VQTSEVVNCTEALRDWEHFRVAVCAEGDGGPPDGHLLAPLWLSGTAVVANLPGVEELRLDTDMLGAILSGYVRLHQRAPPIIYSKLRFTFELLSFFLKLHKNDLRRL
jgi:hypothetical protein